jgi:hypothetical protein
MGRAIAYGTLFLLSLAMPAFAQDVEGFRLGMSLQDVKQLASERGYRFSNPTKDANSSNWVSYLLIKDGPYVSFCGDTLGATGKSWTSNLHEFANMLSQWTTSFGTPEISSKQTYSEGTPFSTLSFKWEGADNVRRDISVFQFGSNRLQISYGVGYINHACRH